MWDNASPTVTRSVKGVAECEESMENGPCNILLLGIDGATFKIIEPLVNAGRLPNIARLMRDGVHGVLTSTVPVVSPVAWTSFMTGMNPGKHQIFDFQRKVPRSYQFRINSAEDRNAKAFWTMLGEFGKRVCVVGVTSTYPPDSVNGLMVSGLGTPMSPDCIFTHPAELSREISANVGEYRILLKSRPNLDTVSGRDAFIKEMLELIDYRVRLAEYLIAREQHDFRMFFFIDTDGVSHNFWKYMEPLNGMTRSEKDPAHRESIFTIYEKIDDAVGKIAAASGKNTDVVLMSDHGFGPLKRTIALNVWLHTQGLLVFGAGNRKSGVRRIFDRVVRKAFGKKRDAQVECNTDDIDWSRTKAYFNGSVGNIFINVEGRDPQGCVKSGEYDQVRDMIASGLTALVDPGTGEKPVQKVHRKEEAFMGDDLASAPDLVVMFKSGYGVFTGASGSRVNSGTVFEDAHHWSGEHEPDGIFIASGPHFRKGVKVENAHITDIAPTLLYLYDVPVPESMDGKILLDTIDRDFAQDRSVIYAKSDRAGVAKKEPKALSDDDAEIVKKHLRDLGYME